MTSVAEIGIRVDTTDVVQAATDLDKMTDAGKRSEDSVKRTGKAWEQAVGGMAGDTQRIVKELQNLNSKQDQTAKMMADIGRSISSASSSFQSAAASMGSYRAQSDAVNTAQSKIAQSGEKAGKAASGVAAGFEKAAVAANGLSSAENKLSESTDAALARLTAMARSSLDTSEYYQRVSASIGSNTSALDAAKSSGTDYIALQKRLQAASDELVGTTEKGAAATRQSAAATSAQAEGLQALLGKINPAMAALEKLDQQQAQLQKYKGAGLIDAETFRDYSSRIDASRQQLGGFDDSLRKTGVSAGQTQAALRQLPAQFTDIFTSLAGGQNPLMVLIQQGGQIKDSFGGIGNTLDVFKSKFSSLFAGGAGVAALGESLAGIAVGAQAAGESAQAAGAGLDSMAEGANTAADAAKNAKEASAALGLTGVPVSAGLGLIVGAAAAAAAAIGALIYGYSQGSKEADEYNKALILSGNYAGTSASQLAELAKQVSVASGTTGEAAASLAKLAAGGVVASESFKEVASAAAAMEDATGRSVDATIAEFVKIGKDPVAAAKELNDQYGFMTASVYSQITALKEQGDTVGAADLLTKTYADTVQSRSKQVTENLGLWEKAWKGVKDAASAAVDGLKEAGREKSYADQIDDLKAKLTGSAAFDIGGLRMNPGAVSSKERADIQGQISFIEMQRDADQARTKYLAEQAKSQKGAIAGIDLINKEADAAATNVEKLNKRLGELDKARAKNVANDSWSAGDQAKYEKSAAALRKQIADDQKKSNKTAASSVDLSGFNDAQNKLKLITSEYQNSQQKLNAAQKSGLLSQKDFSDQSAALVEQEKGRITAAYQAEIDALESAKSRKSTSAEQRIALDQKIADARTNMVRAQQDADTQLSILATNEKGRIDKQTAAVQTYIDALDDQLAATKRQLELSVSGVGMGDEARRRLQEDIKIQQEYQDKLDKLLAQKNKNQIDDSVYEKETEAVRDAMAQRLEMQRDYYGAVEAEQTNWANGASSAYATYLEQVKDVAGQTKSAFTSAFKGIEDVFVEFITTGKASFKDFANSVPADLARIVVKQQIMAPLLRAMPDGTSPSGGIGQASGEMLGGGTGSGFTDILSMSKNAVSLYNTGAGQAFASGFESGTGFIGSVEGGINASYASLSGSVTGNTAAIGSMQAGYTGSAMANWSAGQASSSAGSAAGGAASSSAGGAGISALGYAGYGLGGAISGYQQAGVKGAVTGAGGAMAGAYAGAQIGSFVGPLGTAIGAALGAILGGMLGSSVWGGEWVTKDQGLQLAVKGGDLDAKQYEKQTKKGGLFGSDKKRTNLTSVDPEMQKSLDAAYDATESSVYTLFDRLNVELNDGVLDGLSVAKTKISTKKKTAEEIQAEIVKWFAGVADSMVVAVDGAVGGIGLGNRTFESLTTFVNNLYSVNDVLENLNVGLFGFSVDGGLLAESLSAMAGGLEALTKNAGTYYENFFSDTEKADDTLAAVGKQFAAINLALPDTRQGYRDIIEALDVTTTAGQSMFVTLTGLAGNAAAAYSILEQRAVAAKEAQAAAAAKQAANDANYYNLFTTDTEKTSDKLSDITAQFAAMGVVLPATKEQYKEMVYAAGLAGESGKKLFDFLKGMAGDASDAFSIAAQKTETLKSNAIAGATSAMSMLQRSINAQQKTAQAAYTATNTALNDMASTASKSVSDLTSVGNDLGSALKALRGDSDEAVKMLRSQAQATLQSALATARSGGSLAGFSGLEDALDTIGSNNTDLYGSMEDFARDQGRTANVVAELNALNGKQLTAAETLQRSLEDQIEQAKEAYDLQIAQFESEQAFAQAQLDALNGVNTSVTSVSLAVMAMNAAVVAALAALPRTGAGSAVANTPQNNGNIVDSIYQSVLGRNTAGDEAGAAFWAAQLQSGALGYDQIAAAIAQGAVGNSAESAATKANAGKYLGLPGYATGGLISGPGTGTSDSIIARLSSGEYVMSADAVQMFGTGLLDQMNAGNLPKLAGGGGQVRNYNASQTAATLNGSSDSGATNAELRRQLAEIYSGLAIMNKHMEKTAHNTTHLKEAGIQAEITNTVKTEAA